MKFKFLDRERELKYTFGDIRRLREKYSAADIGIDTIPDIVALGLRRDDPQITPEQVAEIVDMETFTELCYAVNHATGLGKPAAARPTSESSENIGPSPDTTSGSPSVNSGD